MAKRQVLDKFGCTFDDYHSLLRQCHRQRQERGDNRAFKSENMQSPPPHSPSSPQQQQQHHQQQKRRPMSHILSNNEGIPYEYMDQSSSALASPPPLNEAWFDGRRRQFSKSSESSIHQEPIPALDSRTANSSSHLQRFNSWSQPQPRTKISATNTWSETSNTLPTTTWVDSYHTSESSTSSIADLSVTKHNNNYNTNDIVESSNRNRVKPVKPERFEDLQLEAMNHWTNGIDLNLEKTQQKKGKKSGWLTMEEFATFNAAPRQDQAMKATHMTTSTSHERKTPSSSSSTSSSSSSSPSSTLRQPTINATSTPPPPRFTTFKTTATTPSTNLNVANSSKMESGPVLAKLVANLPKGNHGVYQFLDAIQQQHDGFGERSLPAFIKALPLILSNLPNESNRTFKKFVSTLLIVLGDTTSPLRPGRFSDKQSVSKTLEDFKLSIIEAATRYIESYVVVASDFSLLLDFMVCFTRELPTTFAAATVPPILHALQEHYNQLRDLLLPRPCKEIYQHLMQLQLWVSANLVEIPAAANPPARSNHAPTVPPTTSLPLPPKKEERILEKEQVQQEQSQRVSETDTTPIKTFLQQQLSKYQDYMKYIKSTATKLAASSSPTKEDYEWTIFRNARQYPPMLLAPVIPDTVTVYRCDDQFGQGLLHASLIGCVAIVISDDKRSTSPDSIMVGTTIQYASSDTHDDERIQPFAIALNQKEHLDHGGTYTLILTSIKATPLLPLMDWLQHTCANLNENDFSRDLISCLLSVFPDASTTDFVPDYLQNFALDISTLMTSQYRGCKAKVSENSWPQLQPKHLRLPPDRRPLLYVISESQVASLQYALSHRFAVVRGGPGTGKTFLAGKLLELSYQVLKQRHIHQPILVMAASASTLLTLLSSVAQPPLAQDMVIFGNDDEGGTGAGDIGDQNRLLSARGAMKLSTLSKGSAAWKQHRHESRELEQCHGKLIVLQEHRQSVVVDQDPKYIVDLMPPSYRNALIKLCPQNDDATAPNAKTIGKLWIQQKEDEEHATSLPVQTYTRLLDNITNQVTTMQPITKRDDFLQQQQWMDTHRPFLAPLSEGRSWPFILNPGEYGSYLKTAGDQVRYALFNIWTLVDASDLWELPVAARRQMYNNVVDTYREHVDKMIKYLLAQQDRLLASLHRLRTAQWQSTCTFNRVVAMTTGFAMANQAFVRALSPHVVIVDDAHTVSGGFLAATGAMSGVEHLVLLDGEPGDSQDQNRFLVPSRHAHELVDQWRMVPDIFRLWQAALDQKATSSTTIPAMKKPDPSEAVQGMKHRTSLMVFDNEDVTSTTNQTCQFIAHLALYLYQQNEKAADIAILTNSHGDRELLQLVVAQLANTTLFSAGFVGSVKVECVDAFKGKECDLALLFINSPFSVDQMSVALSRARKGLYIIGERRSLAADSWRGLVDFMQHEGNTRINGRTYAEIFLQGLSSTTISLQCQKHMDTETLVAHPDDFVKVKNGGCSVECKTLMSCGHVCQEGCHHRSHSLLKCQHPCGRPRPLNCPHRCKQLCYECQATGCPPCPEYTELLLPCDHRVNISCSQQQADNLPKIQCQELATVTLGCGHVITTSCHDVISGEYAKRKCTEPVERKLDCGHIVKAECGSPTTCTKQCGKALECGHSCQQMCCIDHQHDRKQCLSGCPKHLICGHQCAKGCANPDNHTERCLKNCERLCMHGYKCDRMCWEACIKCMNPCPNECPHSSCCKKCYEVCDREPCEEPCTKTLDCSHPCRSTCGEPCSICPICDPDTQCPITLRPLSEFDDDEKIYTLPDCGCSFSLKGLDSYFESQVNFGEHMAIKQRVCPSCLKPVYTAIRFGKQIKSQLNLIDAVKEQQELILQQLTDEEKYNIINAMNEESMASINNIVGGRWFVCKNQHPYFIGDCGGATEVSVCPQCNEAIGGLQHQVINTNRFYGEFDGSAEPAWPGQPRS